MSRQDAARPAPSRGPLQRTLAIVIPYLRDHRLLLIAGVITLILEVGFRILEPWPLKIAIDSLAVSLGASGEATTGIPPATTGLLVACGAILLGVIVLRAVTSFFSTVAFALVGSRIATKLRAAVFSHLQSLPLRYHAVAPAGDTVQRVVGDVGRLQEVAVSAGLPLIANVLTLVILTGVMIWMDPLLALIVVAAAAAYFLLSRRSTGAITVAARTTRKGEGALAETANEALGAIRVVQAYGLEEELSGAFAKGNQKALREGVRARRLAAALERRTDVIVGLAMAIVLVVGGWRVLQQHITPGDLVVFTAYLKIALRPLKDLAKYTGRIARAAASGERIADLLDEPVVVKDRAIAWPLDAPHGEVSFRNVFLTDGRGQRLFTDLNLTVRAGETVCLLGPSGAGKSTLASLVTRAVDPVGGSVHIDGTDLRDVTLASVRANVSILLQETVLFATSVRENIRYGRLDATDIEVELAARAALADEFISALPQGYETVLGSRGGTLSGGQRQRIAIARAMLRGAPVVILDEATTGLDPKARATVSASLARLAQGRTTIVITHDPVAVSGADRLVWLEDGQIQEQGTPEECRSRSGSRIATWFAQAQGAPKQAQGAPEQATGVPS